MQEIPIRHIQNLSITVDVFDSQANYQGIQSGWFAKIVKEKFNMELNIIAPNVAGGGDTLFQTRSAAGDLGDLIITGANNGRLQNLVEAGLVMDMTEYLANAENVHRYDAAIEKTAELVEQDGIYAIPSEVSSNSPTTSSEGLEPNYGAYIRWDAYKAAGYPEINTLEDLLPALKAMQAAYNTDAHKAEGKGFMLAPIADETIFSYGCQINGNPNNCIMIGSKAEDPQRLADFIDWLYSPEGVMASCAQTASSCGPEGLTWEMQDGQPVLTDFGKQALYGEAVNVPDEWGGGTWKDGVSALNYKAVNQLDSNPDTGICYDYTTWDSVLAGKTDPLTTDWQEKMGAQTTMEYLNSKGQILVAPGSAYVVPEEDSQITTLRGQCKASIVEYSWKMVFAADENEFNSLLLKCRRQYRVLIIRPYLTTIWTVQRLRMMPEKQLWQNMNHRIISKNSN